MLPSNTKRERVCYNYCSDNEKRVINLNPSSLVNHLTSESPRILISTKGIKIKPMREYSRVKGKEDKSGEIVSQCVF